MLVLCESLMNKGIFKKYTKSKGSELPAHFAVWQGLLLFSDTVSNESDSEGTEQIAQMYKLILTLDF